MRNIRVTDKQPKEPHKKGIRTFQRDKDYLRNADMEKEPWQIYLPMALFVYSQFHWNAKHDRGFAEQIRGCVLHSAVIRGKMFCLQSFLLVYETEWYNIL